MFSVPILVSSRFRNLFHVSAVAVLAATGAGCSTGAVRLSDPVFTGSTPNQQKMLASTAPVAPATPAYIPPATGSYALATPAPVVRQPMPPQLAPLSSAPPSQIYAAAGLPKPVGVVPVAGATPRLPVSATPYASAAADEEAPAAMPSPVHASASDLPPGYKPSGTPRELGRLVLPKERPVGPRKTVVASLAPAPSALSTPVGKPSKSGKPAATASTPGSYVVKPGESLWTIAKKTGTTTRALISANKLKSPDLVPGTTITIPKGATAVAAAEPILPPAAKTRTAAAALPTPIGPIATPASEPVPVAPREETVAAPPPPPPVTAPAPVATAEVEDRDSGSGFRWPVRGRVIAGFGKRGSGERNDGINLAVPEGTPVKAAEAGTVIYAGSELKNYGQLILVRHANGFVSAYAHNGSLKVKRGEKVARGAVIATSGRSGDVSSPQLHFELRKGATPVNPLDYLAG